MNRELTLTLCIATYNGANKLLLTLSAILNSTIIPNEIVIYVDGSTDNSVELLKSYQKSLPLKVIVGENYGRATARNKAFASATSNIVMFIDDDIIIQNNSIQKHLEFHKHNENSILTVPSFTIPNKFDFSNFKIFLEHKWNNVANSDTSILAFSAACFSICKSEMERVGGFFKGLNDAEDYEFGIRARKNGVKIIVDPEIWVKHNDEINCERFINRNRQYSNANQQLLSAGIIKENQYVNKSKPLLKKIFFYFFAKRFFVKLVDANFFTFLYKPIRYKLYDYISAAFIHYYPQKKLND